MFCQVDSQRGYLWPLQRKPRRHQCWEHLQKISEFKKQRKYWAWKQKEYRSQIKGTYEVGGFQGEKHRFSLSLSGYSGYSKPAMNVCQSLSHQTPWSVRRIKCVPAFAWDLLACVARIRTFVSYSCVYIFLIVTGGQKFGLTTQCYPAHCTLSHRLQLRISDVCMGMSGDERTEMQILLR